MNGSESCKSAQRLGRGVVTSPSGQCRLRFLTSAFASAACLSSQVFTVTANFSQSSSCSTLCSTFSPTFSWGRLCRPRCRVVGYHSPSLQSAPDCQCGVSVSVLRRCVYDDFLCRSSVRTRTRIASYWGDPVSWWDRTAGMLDWERARVCMRCVYAGLTASLCS